MTTLIPDWTSKDYAGLDLLYNPENPLTEIADLNRIEEVLVALRRVIRATDLHSKHLAKTAGLTAPQILLLQTVRNKGEVTIGELAQDMSLSQATVTTIMPGKA